MPPEFIWHTDMASTQPMTQILSALVNAFTVDISSTSARVLKRVGEHIGEVIVPLEYFDIHRYLVSEAFPEKTVLFVF